MKKHTIILLLSLFSMSLFAQETDSCYVFDTVYQVPTTVVKDQHRSGTCWAFAATSFVETELIRMGHPEIDLSEMYFVYDAYTDKAINYIQLHGRTNFGAGGQAHDVTNTIRKCGMVTESAYAGLEYGQAKHNHGALDALLTAEVKAISQNRSGALSPNWINVITATLDTYLGERPESFEYDGKSTTPKQFTNDLNFNPDDYVEITSYTHHPFYSTFRLEVPDNWSFDEYYNVPLEDFMKIMESAFAEGYSVCWDGDVSDKGFSHNHGVAIVPAEELSDKSGSEKDRWSDLTEKEKNEMMYSFEAPIAEKEITQNDRQDAFNSRQSTDDHLMHLTGIVKDQHGTKYYITKNSWNYDSNDFGGYLNMSESFIRLKTVAIMVHKEAIPKNIRKKMGL